MSDETTRRVKTVEDDIKDVQEAIYGNKDFIGLSTRLKVVETRLQIFWWALAVVGSTVIAIAVTAVFNKMKLP